MDLPWLDPLRVAFPPTCQSFDEPNGLLAAGGGLTPEWLITAYQHGIFPWYNEGDPILWWSPAPRMVIYPPTLHISRSLRKAIRKSEAVVTINHDFNGVINACSEPRPAQDNEEDIATWISQDMKQAYNRLHRLGYAHSVEVWENGQLIGGLYGIAIGRVFFGESMFSRVNNASKIAIAYLAHYLTTLKYELIDCQVHNDHLASLGGEQISRESFEALLTKHAQLPNSQEYQQHWQLKTLICPLVE